MNKKELCLIINKQNKSEIEKNGLNMHSAHQINFVLILNYLFLFLSISNLFFILL